MKSTTLSSFRGFAGAIAAAAVVFLAACSKTDSPSGETGSASAASTTDQQMSSMLAATTDTWDNVKDYSFERRAELEAKAAAMTARLEQQAVGAEGEKARGLAEARDELRSAVAEVSNATIETWDTTKERVGRAWQKAESAFQHAAE